MLSLIEIIFTCWVVLLPNGDAFCYCQGETPPVAYAAEQTGRRRSTANYEVPYTTEPRD